MKENYIIKGKFYYFFIAIIILSRILIFYLSCNSKSPTDAQTPAHSALTAQGVNNTKQTTTSSNTTTLITSRNLTTTSTRTTTSSSSTTSSTSTTAGTPSLWFCEPFIVVASTDLSYTVSDGRTIYTTYLITLVIYSRIRNNGTASASNVTFSITNSSGFPITIIDGSSLYDTIPSDYLVYQNAQDTILILLGDLEPGSTCTLTLTENYSNKTFTFTIQIS